MITELWNKLKHTAETHPVITGIMLFLMQTGFYQLTEAITYSNVTDLTTAFDRRIPFVRQSVIFYFMWYIEIFVIIAWHYFRKDMKGYWRVTAMILIGLYATRIFGVIFPNEVNLRPFFVNGSDICSRLTRWVYASDDNQSVFPSGHAFGAFLMMAEWARYTDKRWQRGLNFTVNAGIVLSTVLLKQHSIYDVIGGFFLAVVIFRSFVPSGEEETALEKALQ